MNNNQINKILIFITVIFIYKFYGKIQKFLKTKIDLSINARTLNIKQLAIFNTKYNKKIIYFSFKTISDNLSPFISKL